MTNALYQYHEYNKDDERMTFLLAEEDVGIIPAIKKLYREIFRRLFKVYSLLTLTHPIGPWVIVGLPPDGRTSSTSVNCWWTKRKIAVSPLAFSHSLVERQFLYDLSELAHKQGFDWDAFYKNDIPKESTKEINLHIHGVNNAQGLKGCAVWYVLFSLSIRRYRMSKDDNYKDKCLEWVNTLMTYHGQVGDPLHS